MLPMKQSSLGLGESTKRTRKREVLVQMEHVVAWEALQILEDVAVGKAVARPSVSSRVHVFINVEGVAVQGRHLAVTRLTRLVLRQVAALGHERCSHS